MLFVNYVACVACEAVLCFVQFVVILLCLEGPAQHCDYLVGKEGAGNFITKTCLYNFDPLKPHFYICSKT